jgi:hypothetical protein
VVERVLHSVVGLEHVIEHPSIADFTPRSSGRSTWQAFANSPKR